MLITVLPRKKLKYALTDIDGGAIQARSKLFQTLNPKP